MACGAAILFSKPHAFDVRLVSVCMEGSQHVSVFLVVSIILPIFGCKNSFQVCP